jgi:hypothetical protein
MYGAIPPPPMSSWRAVLLSTGTALHTHIPSKMNQNSSVSTVTRLQAG